MDDFDRDFFDDDDDSIFDDDDSGLGDDLGFDDDLGLGDDLDFDDDLGLGDDDISFDDDFTRGDGGGGGPSRTFVIIAVVLIVLLLLGFGLIALIVLNGRGPSDNQKTATSVVMTNRAVELEIAASETQNKVNLDLTMTREALTDTPSPTFTPSETPPPTEDTSATEAFFQTQTLEAADALATQTSVALTMTRDALLNPTEPIIQVTPIALTTGTEIAGGATATMPGVNTPVQLSEVQMTATALAGFFVTSTQVIEPTATEGGPTAIPGEVVPTPGGGETALPDTGLFDDVFGGNPATILLAAFGLLGVIMVSRRVRSINRKRGKR